MQRYLRLIALVNAARLRTAGLAPWLIFAGWITVAALQEPRFLRLYGINLLDQAAWSGGTLLLLVLMMAEPGSARTAAGPTNLVLLMMVGVTQATATFCLDLLRGADGVGHYILLSIGFILCWGPLALTMATRVGSLRSPLHGSITVVAAAIGGLLSVSWCRGEHAQVIASACIASVGACCPPGPRLT